MTHTSTGRVRVGLISGLAIGALLLASGCSTPVKPAAPSSETTNASAVDTPSAATNNDPNMAIPGFKVGEVPPVPLFQLPDLSLLSSQNDAFTQKFSTIANKYPGLTVNPARCDDSGSRITPDGAVLAYGDGVSYVGPNGIIINNNDGSGVYNDGGTIIVNNGDGSGTYNGPGGIITNNGDGSGTYNGSDGTIISIDGDGSGTYNGPGGIITNNGDGSGTYNGPDGVIISNNGDGSGTYNGPFGIITNDGDGSATVNSAAGIATVAADPLPPVPPLGKFPPLGALTPQIMCGVSITLDSGLLFDFDKYEIRADAQPVIASVAQVLKDYTVPKAIVEGHTDSIGDEAYNQTLSENRANAVVTALRGQAVTTDLQAIGYGETKPIAPNTTPDGQDNPAGRQLNRRVEIFIPAF